MALGVSAWLLHCKQKPTSKLKTSDHPSSHHLERSPMNQQLLVSTAVLVLSLGASLTAQAQTAPQSGTTSTTPDVTNSTSTNSTFAPGVNPSGTINYNQSPNLSGSSTGSSGFTAPSNTLNRPTSILNNSTYNNSNSTGTGGTINAFPPYDPYTITRPQSIYDPAIGSPNRSSGSSSGGLNTPSGGFGTIR